VLIVEAAAFRTGFAAAGALRHMPLMGVWWAARAPSPRACTPPSRATR
jgi:hypothetical protein